MPPWYWKQAPLSRNLVVQRAQLEAEDYCCESSGLATQSEQRPAYAPVNVWVTLTESQLTRALFQHIQKTALEYHR